MTDTSLSIIAAAIELSLPVLLALSCVLVPRARVRALVVLGAITPLLLAYCYVSLGYLVIQTEQYSWAIGAMWSMSFVPFAACVVVGAALSFIKRPARPLARFLLGLAAPVPVGLLVIAGV